MDWHSLKDEQVRLLSMSQMSIGAIIQYLPD